MANCMISGWDELDFIFSLELETQLKIRRQLVNFPPLRKAYKAPLSEWIREIIPSLRAIVESPGTHRLS